jgi:hypothetical protein
MNDFTKEELEHIRDGLELWNSKHFCSGMRNVYLKIQSMIDNYNEACEHVPGLIGHKTPDGHSVGLITCIKCGVII